MFTGKVHLILMLDSSSSMSKSKFFGWMSSENSPWDSLMEAVLKLLETLESNELY